MHDLIIVGAGPAGLTASIYASCFHLKHLVIGKLPGGQMQYAPEILNYPGFERISGKELTEKMVAQVKKRGGEITVDSVVKISGINNPITQSSNNQNVILSPDLIGAKNPVGSSICGWDPSATPQDDIVSKGGFELETQEGKKYQARALILATGTERRKLNVPGEVEYTGRGVYYCATCERLDYKDKVCGIVGGANSAVQAAVEIAQVATKVYIIYRGSKLRGDPIWLERVEKNSKISVICNTIVTEIIGDGGKVTGVKLKQNNPITQLSNNPINTNNQSSAKDTSDVYLHRRGDPPVGGIASSTGNGNVAMRQCSNKMLPLDKLFIEIGGVPGTALVTPLGVEMDPGGYVKVNGIMATNMAGIFAAGDLASYGLSIEQISSAIGLGARAAASAFAYLKQEKAPMIWGGSQIKREVT